MFRNFEVYAAATTPVAPGDQLRITSNFRSNGDRFINNELVKVLSLDEQKMVVSRGNVSVTRSAMQSYVDSKGLKRS